MIEFSLTKNNAGQIVNAISSIVSAAVEPLKIKITERNTIELLATDKVTDVDVFVQLPISGAESTQLFSMELDRFAKLVAKQTVVELEIRKGMLRYQYNKKVNGSVEIQDCQGSWKFPTLDGSAQELNLFLLKMSQTVKLPPAPGETDTFLFIDYKAEEGELYLAVADNFNIAYSRTKNIKFWNKNWNTVIPFVYVEYARKLAGLAENNKIHILNKEKQCFLHTQNASIQLPSYNVDQTFISMKKITEEVQKANNIKNIAFNLPDLRSFMNNALTIKEADRAASIVMLIKRGVVSYTIETKHGTSRYKGECSNSVESFNVRVSCAALSLVLARIEEESETFYKAVENTLCIVAKKGDTVLNFSLATLEN